MTSSTAERDAQGGNDFLFVSPLRIGRWFAAPGAGTRLNAGSVSGRITAIAADVSDPVTVGVVPTGTVTFFDSSTRVEPVGQPVTFTATVQGAPQSDAGSNDTSVQRSRVTSLTVTFSTTEAGGYALHANRIWEYTPCCDPSPVAYEGFLGGVRVATGDLGDGADGEIPGLVVDSIPDTFDAHAGSGRLRSMDGGSTWTLHYDQAAAALVRSADGEPLAVTLDRIEVHGADRPATWDNVKQTQWRLGAHVFQAEGVQQMSITPAQGG